MTAYGTEEQFASLRKRQGWVEFLRNPAPFGRNSFHGFSVNGNESREYSLSFIIFDQK